MSLMSLPGRQAIHAAELRVARARLDAQDRLREVRPAIRNTITRPATLVLVAGVSCVLGFLAAGGPRPSREDPSSAVLPPVAKASAAMLVLGLVGRYALQAALPHVLNEIRRASQKRGT